MAEGPAWDLDGNGKFSLDEANNWFRTGNGVPVTVQLSSIDFSNVYRSEVTDNNGFVNLFLGQSIISQKLFDGGGDVYGTIRLEIVSGLTIKTPEGYTDLYDFDQPDPWNLNPLRMTRNLGTLIGELQAGEGQPFRIFFAGTATLGGYSPPPPK